MPDDCHAAATPGNRRLFEAGWLGREHAWDPSSMTWAGLKVARHMGEQF